MRPITILRITTLLLFSPANLMALAVTQHWSTPSKTEGWVHGTVVDVNDSRLAGAIVSLAGEGLTYNIATAEDGTFRIEVPIGIYRISVNKSGFCPARRAPFRVQASTDVMLNFTLVVSSLIHEMKIVNDQYVEVASYSDPFKEEVLRLTEPLGAPSELLLRYKERLEDGGITEYREATLSYDTLLLRANKVRLNRKTFQVDAGGNLVVEDGKQSIRAKRAVISLQTGSVTIETDLYWYLPDHKR